MQQPSCALLKVSLAHNYQVNEALQQNQQYICKEEDFIVTSEVIHCVFQVPFQEVSCSIVAWLTAKGFNKCDILSVFFDY